MYCDNLVSVVQVLRSSRNHFNTRIILAVSTAIHTPDSTSVNESEAISDADQSTERTSTEDEDPNEEVVNDPDVIAEVKLPSTIRKFNILVLHFLVAKCMP